MGLPSPAREEPRKEEVAGERSVIFDGPIPGNAPFPEITVGSRSEGYRSLV